MILPRNPRAAAPIPSLASHRSAPRASTAPRQEQQGHPLPPAGQSGGIITSIQARRHIVLQPRPDRAQLITAALVVGVVTGAAITFAIGQGWLG